MRWRLQEIAQQILRCFGPRGAAGEEEVWYAGGGGPLPAAWGAFESRAGHRKAEETVEDETKRYTQKVPTCGGTLERYQARNRTAYSSFFSG